MEDTTEPIIVNYLAIQQKDAPEEEFLWELEEIPSVLNQDDFDNFEFQNLCRKDACDDKDLIIYMSVEKKNDAGTKVWGKGCAYKEWEIYPKIPIYTRPMIARLVF
jgi:hypothetical protein